MRCTYLFYCLSFFSLMLTGMDDDEPHGAHDDSDLQEKCYTFPALTEVHAYPIRIYEQQMKRKTVYSAEERYERFVNYRKAAPLFKRKLKLKYDALLQIAANPDEVHNRLKARKEEKKAFRGTHLGAQLSRLKSLGSTTKEYGHFLEYKKFEEEIDQNYKKLLKVTKNPQKVAELNQKIKEEKEQWRDTCFGTFFIYTAINKKKQYENPFHCLWSLKLQEAARVRLHEFRQGNLLREDLKNPDECPFLYTEISEPDQQECDETLREFVLCLSYKNALLRIGPYTLYRYTPFLEQQSDMVPTSTASTHSGVVNTTDTASPTKTGLSKKHILLEKKENEMELHRFDERHHHILYLFWPDSEYETKKKLKAIMDINDEKKQVQTVVDDETVKLRSVYYGESPSSSPESSSAILCDIEAKTVVVKPQRRRSRSVQERSDDAQ